MFIFKIILVLLKIIGILLLILLGALCIPVHLDVLYDETVIVKIKYMFIKYTFDSAKANEEENSETQKEEKPPGLFKTILMYIVGFLVWLLSLIKQLFSAIIRYSKRGIATLKKKFKKKSKLKKKTSNGGHQAKKDKPKQSLFGRLREERGFWGATKFFVDIGKALGGAMVRIYRGVAINQFTLRVAVAGEDAADTAIKYGEVCSAAFPALSFLLTNARRYEQDIEINPNFHNNGNKIYFDGQFVIYPILVLAHLLGAVVRFLVLQIKITLQNKKDKEKG